MVIVYKDGGKLSCNYCEFTCSEIIADDIYIVPFEEIECIMED